MSDIYVRHIMRPGLFALPVAGRMICGPYKNRSPPVA